MLSRVADSLYWMSRYLERAEHTTRLVDVNLSMMLDENASSSGHRWTRLVQSLGNPKRAKWDGNPYSLAGTLIFDLEHKSSVLSCITAARENARHVREQISTEQWQRLNSLYLEVIRVEHRDLMQAGSLQISGEAPSNFLLQVMEAIHQFQGITDSTMSHGEGWQFIQVGRFLERASATATLLEAYHHDLWAQPERAGESNQFLAWMGLLRSCTAFEAYCKVYTADLSPERITEFLLLDPEFPHALRFSIEALEHALEAIQAKSGPKRGNPRADQLSRMAGRLSAQLGFAGIDDLLTGNIIDFLHSIQRQCSDIHNGIYELYVDYPIQVALAG